ncbi:MAG: SirB1 family protein [Betaproteobacteria bacterium]|nr:tetratricopeptide repeat protein [Rhodocyclaceae bacterium]MCA3135260.1 tetratricopeptide repeat protein [Rhodocyclaceae bacterium]MCA3141690.1 tetratricopeptide repeat protein [Rhodocyclaceae bacterium]MCA3145292.1 tetratricopeptide repeat protein [Rhodocyclaceae bacterium]MCE2896834.1 tetratricopeptide repeat protein [Betaproteobacteria bacterium]
MAPKIPARLREILDAPSESVCLAEAALQIAQGQYPALDPAFCLGQIEEWAGRIRVGLRIGAGVPEVIGAMNFLLFQELGFRADTDNYYDPRNNFLNEVMERRRGIPISLSILYIALGRRLGLDLKGVSFPGHFLVKCPVDGGVAVIDPYYCGITLSLEDLQKRLREFRGGEVSRAIVSELLVAATPRDVVVRVLRNLKGNYLREREFTQALAAIEWIMALVPSETDELRDRGIVFQELDCFRAALTDFEHYLTASPAAPDAEAVRFRVVEMRKAVARLN